MPLFTIAQARPALFPVTVAAAAWLAFSPAGHAQSLTLEEAIQIAEINQPLLASQEAAARSAAEMAISARQLPDPQLKLGVLNLPVTGPDAFSLTRDFMTMRMIGVMQEFPREAKRKLRSQLAQLDGEGKRLEQTLTRRTIRREVAAAWIEALYTQRAAALVSGLQREAERQIDALTIALRAGKASQADVLAARVDLETLKDRAAELSGSDAVARAELSRWIREAAQRPLAGEPAVPEVPALEALLAQLEQHPRVATSDKQINAAETEVELARVGTRPDWNAEVSYNVRGTDYSDMVSIQFGIDLPVFPKNRQTREVAARLAAADEARAMRADALAEMRAELRRYHVQWASARERAQRFREVILPQARARVDAALAAYRAGQGALLPVLEARRMEVDLRMQQLMLEGEAAKVAFPIAYFARQ